MFKIGFGFDVHKLAEGYKLILGGIEVPFPKGLVGHSDADVVLHAISDALLGAVALGDIGKHFPDTDPAYKGADSKILLKEVYTLVKQEGYKLGNVDVTIAMQVPKLRPYIDEMRACITELLETEISNVSVKATTTEQMGFEGRSEGVSCYATVLVVKKES